MWLHVESLSIYASFIYVEDKENIGKKITGITLLLFWHNIAFYNLFEAIY